VPLHSSPFARTLGLREFEMPITADIAARLVRLPMYYDLSDRGVAEVASAVTAFYEEQRR